MIVIHSQYSRIYQSANSFFVVNFDEYPASLKNPKNFTNFSKLLNKFSFARTLYESNK